MGKRTDDLGIIKKKKKKRKTKQQGKQSRREQRPLHCKHMKHGNGRGVWHGESVGRVSSANTSLQDVVNAKEKRKSHFINIFFSHMRARVRVQFTRLPPSWSRRSHQYCPRCRPLFRRASWGQLLVFRPRACRDSVAQLDQKGSGYHPSWTCRLP